MPIGFRELSGFRVIISHPDSAIFPDESGMDIGTFSKTNIAVDLTQIQRLPAPYPSNCTSSWNQTEFAQTTVETDEPYSPAVSAQKISLLNQVVIPLFLVLP